MKRVILVAICLCLTLFLNAQVLKTANVSAGGLSSSLTAIELSTVTNLTLTGFLDSRDFKIMRDEMPVLAVLDLSQVTIQAYNGTEGTDAIQGDYPADEIPRYSFCKITSGSAQGKGSLTSVVFPYTINSIGKFAFAGCANLLGNLVIPNSVTTIGDYAFDGCFRIAGTLTLSNNLVSIGRGAFSGCSVMTGSLTIPNSVITIGSNAFSGCSRLDGSLTLSSNLTSISDSAFYFCSRLTGNLSIPSNVSSIGSFAFANCGGFTGSLVLPANLTSLGSYAFYGSKYTGTLTIPTSITEIKDGTFAFGSGYSSVVFPPLLTKIGKSAFESCPLWSGVLSLPSTVSSIGDAAFSSCSKLTGVIFPENLTSIGGSAFSGCIGLQGTLTIPNSVLSLGETAFYSCTGLKTVNLPSSLVTIPYGLFKYCSGLDGNFKLPESATSIGFAAFANCTTLNSINIPNSVTAIYQAAFSGCTSLTSIWAYRTIPVDLSSASYVFDNVNKTTCTIYVPAGSKAAYQSANKWKDFTNIVEMPSLTLSATTATLDATLGNKTTIELTSNTDWTASSDQTWLTVSPTSGNGNQTLTFTAEVNLLGTARTATVTVSATDVASQTVVVTQQVKGVKTMNVTAGGLKTSLTTDELVSITNLTLTGTIDARDFKTMRDDMPLLAVLDLSGVTIVEYHGSDGTYPLSDTSYPANVFPLNAFANKNSLKSVIISLTITAIGTDSFAGCKNLTSITIPEGISVIEFGTFQNCTSLTSIAIPSSITTIDPSVFLNCKCLVTVDPNNLNFSSIDGILFNKSQTSLLFCPNSKTGIYIIPSSVISIGDKAFWYCSGLTSVTIPSTVTSIGYSAFSGCSGMSSIFIPSSVINIRPYAFDSNTGLITVDEINPNYSSSDGVLFNKTKSVLIQCPISKTGIYSIPSSVDSIGVQAFYNCSLLTKVNISSSVTSIGDLVFFGCVGLTSVSIPSSVSSIGVGTFDFCQGLTSITIPSSVKSIGQSAFLFCSGLTSISISSSVTSIGSQAFGYCSNLNSIVANSTSPPDLSSSPYVFDGVDKTTCTLYVPYATKAAYQTANQWQDFTNIVEMSGLKLSSTTANVSAKQGSTTTVELTSNTAWTASSEQTWLTVSPKSGTGNQTLIFTAEINPSIETRKATVTVSSVDIVSQNITVIQEGFSEISSVTQQIPLSAGWNIISANVIPANLSMKDIFQPLIEAGKLKKVTDEAGKTIENFGAFGGWKNNIGNLNSAKGYKVNVTAASTLSLEGIPVQLPMDIPLAAGWNIISYPSATAQDAKALVQALIETGKLKKVMDEAGKTIENFGAFGGWKNNIGNFVPGKGYKVNVLDNCTLTIPATGTKAAIIIPEVLASTHFAKVYVGNGTDHESINLVNLQASGLQVGDEIGIFDNNLCVGSATIDLDQLMEGSISITASANDGLGETLNGFTAGHSILFRLFHNNQEYILSAETVNNSQNTFAKGESMFAKVSVDSTTGLTEMEASLAVKCYPNPFSELVNIEFFVPTKGMLNATIYNNVGQLVETLFNGNLESGYQNLHWNRSSKDGQQVVSGIYTCKITFNQNSVSKNLIVK